MTRYVTQNTYRNHDKNKYTKAVCILYTPYIYRQSDPKDTRAKSPSRINANSIQLLSHPGWYEKPRALLNELDICHSPLNRKWQTFTFAIEWCMAIGKCIRAASHSVRKIYKGVKYRCHHLTTFITEFRRRHSKHLADCRMCDSSGLLHNEVVNWVSRELTFTLGLLWHLLEWSRFP